MNFLSTSILSAISTVVRLASGLVINKIVAVYIGPAGVALIGQFQNFLGIITTVGNGAVNSGVTKYVAEYNEDEQQRNGIISAAFRITFIFSLIIGALVFFNSIYLSIFILNTEEYSFVFKVLGVLLIFIGLNTVLLSIINGLKQIKWLIAIQVSGSLLSLLITSVLTIKYAVLGALLAMVIVQALILIIIFPIAFKKLNIKIGLNNKVGKVYYRRLFGFSLMAIVSVITGSVTQILIRNHLIVKYSIEQAGYWQSVWMISTMYLMVLTTAFSTYYLPTLSELHHREELRKEILSGYKLIIPFVIISATSIFLLRDLIIQVLFTSEFLEMRSLFLFQLIGDFFKMASWTLAFLMAAKAMTKTFIITEIVFSASFYILTVLFTQRYGLAGVTYAHALNYLGYLILMLYLFRDIVFNKKKVGEQ